MDKATETLDLTKIRKGLQIEDEELLNKYIYFSYIFTFYKNNSNFILNKLNYYFNFKKILNSLIYDSSYSIRLYLLLSERI